MAHRAFDREILADALISTENHVLEFQVQGHQRILAAPPARNRAAGRSPAHAATEERIENILEGAKAAASHTTAAQRIFAAHIVEAALLFIGQDVVGFVDRLKIFSLIGTGDIRVKLARQLAISLLDLVSGSVTVHAKSCVIVSHSFSSFDRWALFSAP